MEKKSVKKAVDELDSGDKKGLTKDQLIATGISEANQGKVICHEAMRLRIEKMKMGKRIERSCK
ncbi:hypothetical protein [Vibrio sp. SCSIO 43136]|uniref:hypothetical protein n=1 Tax=Vibrio sp. SCSIO 43136 TaxID=2819101 RepID=UPI002075123F|nr:hypothetical protein [Vibrio sp. SCSIO 43136]USD65088.1 hypothetical protein J4N39_13695 [Vibrio sp. SCSIO 43136]